MGRWIILGIVVAVALTIYAVVDCAMTDGRRARVLQKPIWIIVVLLIPVIGPLLWIFIGKGNGQAKAQRIPPEDSQVYGDTMTVRNEHDDRIAELEEQMRLLDEEIERDRQNTMRNHPSSHTGGASVVDGEDDEGDDSDETTDSESNGDDEGRRQ
ncbi:PLD nuclease N-terminal domain-containing protein [Gulosibacter sp. 10]|uniref:PLD nuclease N-terminal domain-containing protein n=1 Tax=Gulosibacter sp. 10 TaxID=1255570 RepID=UPI00097F6407|nr:PLD nuclease N-terminal domain-containing protein [Gulosibacter sp. 10]SJM56003.1 Membrane protein [Gulosibacter sp. 10]